MEQNSSRLTDSKKGLVVTKGEVRGGRRGLRGIMISTHGVEGGIIGRHVAHGRQVVTVWHITTLMDSDFSGDEGDLIIWVSVVTTMFFM